MNPNPRQYGQGPLGGRDMCSHDRQMSPHGFAQQKMADVIFIINHRFYLKSFITFINATKVY